MKIYDGFLFFNELDLLEIRLELLYDHVDYFVLSETNRTHSNELKELTFMNNKDKFEKYALSFIKEYDYIFYVSPVGVPIEDNSVRTTNVEYRKQIDNMIKYLCSTNLNKINNFAIISGTVENRIDQVKSYLNL